MKEIKAQDPHYIEEYDIHVNRYLTYAQIQQIVDSVKTLDSWSERKQNIDILVLYHATDMTTEQIEKIGHDALVQSGLIEAVSHIVNNLYMIYEAIDYTESIQRSLSQIVKELPKYMNPLQEVMNKYGDKSSKK